MGQSAQSSPLLQMPSPQNSGEPPTPPLPPQFTPQMSEACWTHRESQEVWQQNPSAEQTWVVHSLQSICRGGPSSQTPWEQAPQGPQSSWQFTQFSTGALHTPSPQEMAPPTPA